MVKLGVLSSCLALLVENSIKGPVHELVLYENPVRLGYGWCLVLAAAPVEDDDLASQIIEIKAQGVVVNVTTGASKSVVFFTRELKVHTSLDSGLFRSIADETFVGIESNRHLMD